MTWRLAVSVLAAWLAAGAAAAPRFIAQQQSARERRERAYAASNRGVALLEQFDYAAAAEAFRQALAVEPSLGIAHLDLAIALLYAGQTAAALPEARAALSALPQAPQSEYVLGLIARADNRADDAETAFRRVLQIDPADSGANVNLGQLLLQQRKYAEAAAAFRAAVGAEPYNATAAYGLATALMRSGDTAAGAAQMARFQTLRDSPYAVTYTQGYLQQGRYGEAVASTGAEADLVDRASPRVRFVRAADAVPRTRPDERGASRSAILFDADADGDLDLLSLDDAGARLLRDDSGRFVATAAVPAATGAGERVATAGDYDNDGRPDLFVAGPRSARLLHQGADGMFQDATASAGLPRDLHAKAASWVDVDHDGDLDLVTAGPVRLLRNNGNGTFTDVTKDSGLAVSDADASAPAAVVPTDYDNRRDIDLMILSGGAPPRLFRNMRDGTFQNVAAAIGLPQEPGISAVAAADVNKDGFIDFYFGRTSGPGVFALSNGRAGFVQRDAPAVAGVSLAQWLDYDNDGLLDLLLAAADGPRLLRNVGDGWTDETARAGLDALHGELRAMALGDVDRDGDTDAVLVSANGSAELWRNDGGNARRWLTVALAPRVSNRSGLGAKVEIRAGSLRQVLETSAASPAVGPADLVFGLGARNAADVVRVLWPSGILQSELSPKSPARVEELDRKPSSCPYLYTWNGTRFEFVTDFLGGGEMGDWEAPGQFDDPDPDEYVSIPDGMLQARAGRYEIRITNELEEAMFLDRVRLIAVDHPAGVEVYANEGLKDRPRPPHRLYALEDVRVPEHVWDAHGHDVRALVAARDRRWPDDFALTTIGGYATPHALTIDLGASADRAVLLMTGWTAYAFSTDNVAASQAGLSLQPPVLQVRDESGAWKTVDRNVGFPVGHPQTIAIDMAGRWLSASRDVRIETNMPIYWDQVLVGTPVHARAIATRLEPLTAMLRWRGFSAEASPDGREPFGADYQRVSTVSPWKAFPGAYTREGDVRTLLLRTDDMFIVSRAGDEIALSFDASAAPRLRSGWTRTFLLYADGFSKEMNIRSATPDLLGPLPFHGMSRYPYPRGEHFPDDEAHRTYLAEYNTRIVTRVVPSIDAAAAALSVRPPGDRP
jgi:tetratricopeptide (TPR) repeat protein